MHLLYILHFDLLPIRFQSTFNSTALFNNFSIIFWLLFYYCSVFLFATVPISRINSWESWFIFNLRKNKQVSRAPSTYTSHSFNLQSWGNIMNLLYHIHTYLSSYLLQHLANGSISVSFWGKTASLSTCWGYVTPSVWLALVSAIASCLFQWFIHHTFNPPTTITQVLTLLYMLTLWVCNMTYKFTHIHNIQSFFLFSHLTSKQVSWPRTLISGIILIL